VSLRRSELLMMKREFLPRTSTNQHGQESMNNCFRIDGEKIRLEIKALPGASKTELAGIKDGRLRIRLAAAAEDGKANAGMLNFLSKALDCSKRNLRFLSGEKSRLKTIAIPLESKAQLEEIIDGQRRETGN
jgi:uncharacterized protein (TIGR00251 family)